MKNVEPKLKYSMDRSKNNTHKNLNQDFWYSLRNSMKDEKTLRSIRGRILEAKKIITPIIQELMEDVLIQEKPKNEHRTGGKSLWDEHRKLTVLFNNLNCRSLSQNMDDIDWVGNLIEEISTDFINSNGKKSKQRPSRLKQEMSLLEEKIFNKTLIFKLNKIYEHLGDIIERLRDKYQRFFHMSKTLYSTPKQRIFLTSDGIERNGPSKFQPKNNTGIYSAEICESNFMFYGKEREPKGKKVVSNQIHKSDECLENSEKQRDSKNGFPRDEVVFFGLNNSRFQGDDVSWHSYSAESKGEISRLLGPKNLLFSNRKANILRRGLITPSRNVHEKSHERIPVMEPDEVKDEDCSLRNGNNSKKSRIPRSTNRTNQTHGENLIDDKILSKTKLKRNYSERRNLNLIIIDPENPSNSIIKMREGRSLNHSKSRTRVSTLIPSIVRFSWQHLLIIFAVVKYKCVQRVYSKKFGVLYISVGGSCIRYYRIEFLPKNVSTLKELEFNLCSSLGDSSLEIFEKYLINQKIEHINSMLIHEKAISKTSILDSYMKNIFEFISYMKGQKSTYTEKLNEQNMLKSKKKLESSMKETLCEMFFFCTCRRKNENISWIESSRNDWNNMAVYPVWTIKKSKYYELPKNRRKTDSSENEKIKKDTSRKKLMSRTEMNMQVSEVSFNDNSEDKATINLRREKNTEKSVVNRKVSFRDDVNFSGSNSSRSFLEGTKPNYSGTFDGGNIFEENGRSAVGNLNMADFLMTDSLLKITSSMSDNESDQNSISEKSITKKLNFTDSAMKILEELSEAFDFSERNEFQLKDENLISRFYDESGRPLTEIFNKDGELIARLKNHNIDDLMSLFFDSEGCFVENEYFNEKGVHIRRIFDSKGRIISEPRHDDRIKRIQADLQLVRYYDFEGKPIEHVYDSTGRELRTVGNDLTSMIFNDDGRLNEDLFNRKGRRIDAVFDSSGCLIGKISHVKFYPQLEDQTIRVNNVTDRDSLFRLLEEKSSISCDEKTTTNENSNGENLKSTRKIFDFDGNPITGVYDKKGKALKIVSSGEAEELLPFLFDKKGKFQKKRYDSRGRELKAVFDEHGKLITGLSIQWLDELLGSSFKSKKKVDFKKREGCMLKLHVFDKLFDVDGRMIVQVFDSNGVELISSSSCNAMKLFPFLFDDNGKFIKNRFDCNKRKLEGVYDESGNAISSISPSVMKILKQRIEHESVISECSRKDNSIKPQKMNDSEKIIEHDEVETFIEEEKNSSDIEKEFGIEFDAEIQKNAESDQKTGKKEISRGKSMQKLYDEKDYEEHNALKGEYSENKAGKKIDKFYDYDGNVITSIFDSGGNILKKVKTSNIKQLTPFLFDEFGILREGIYNVKGQKISNIYDQKGRSISRISIPAIVKTEDSENTKQSKIPGSIYDERGNLVQEIYDEEGLPLLKSRKAKLRDLAAVIFDEKGLRRRIFDKFGREIGPVYDYNGNLIDKHPAVKKMNSEDNEHSIILKETGESISNFYDSDGTLIIALYNDFGEELCAVEEGERNVRLLSKFFFDKSGKFSRGRFFNYRGTRIKHVYDMDGNVVNQIWRIDPHLSTQIEKSKNAIQSSKHKKSREDDVIPEEKRNLTSKSDDTLVFSTKKKNSSESHISAASSLPELASLSTQKFYDEHGKLLTGIYNSRNHLLGYTESGNARVLAPYLFNKKGSFVSGRYGSNGNCLTKVFDSHGNPIKKISRDQTKRSKEIKKKKKQQRKYYDSSGNPIKSIYDGNGNEIFVERSAHSDGLIQYLFDKNGNFLDDIHNVKGEKIEAIYDEHHKKIKKSKLVSHSTINLLFKNEMKKFSDEESEDQRHRNYFSILNTFKDKFLTVLFDNQNNPKVKGATKSEKNEDNKNVENVSNRSTNRKGAKKKKKVETKGSRKKNNNNSLYDEEGKIIKKFLDRKGKRIEKVFNPDGNLICELYSPSGHLVKNHILKNMFEDDASFSPKACNSGGQVIDTIYANDKMIRKVFDKNGKPAKIDSGIIYLVSEQSLPKMASSERVKPAARQIQYFSEGQNLNYMIHFEKRTDNCECELCQKRVKNQTTLKNFEGKVSNGLSELTKPFLPNVFPYKTNSERDKYDDGIHSRDEIDSLENLINEAIHSWKNSSSDNLQNPSTKSICLFCRDNKKIPISRNMIEETLRKCSILNGDSGAIGKVSDTFIKYFTTLILKEIKKRIYKKLGEKQYEGRNPPIDVCIGTEVKFEDPLIGKHTLVQTSNYYLKRRFSPNHKFCSRRESEWLVENDDRIDFVCQRAFKCELSNIGSFVILMNSKDEDFANNKINS